MRAFLRPAALVVLAAAIAFAWAAYRTDRSLHVGFPRHMGDLLPLYAVTAPIDFDSHARRRAVHVAIATALVAVVGTAYCVASRRSTIACLIVALASVLATNVAVGYLRHDHAGFVEPFTRVALEYHPVVPLVRDDPLTFIADYPQLARHRELGQHPGTHPPGGVLFLWAGEQLFAPAADPPRPRPTTRIAMLRMIRRGLDDRATDHPGDRTLDSSVWLAVAFTALGVLPAFWLASLAGGAAAARRMLPLYVATPNLILFGATSMDGVFLVFCLVAIASGVAAVRRPSFAWPIVAGVALWLATFMTYAAIAIPALLATLTIVDAMRRRRRWWRAATSLAVARCAAVGVVFVACQLAAERWLRYDMRACVEAAMRIDLRSVGVTGYESLDLWACLAFGNAFAFALGSGVVTLTLVAIALLGGVWRWRPLARFGVAFVVTIAAVATSTLFTLETERVWMFLTPAAAIVATAACRGRVVWSLALLGLLGQTFWTEMHYRTWW